MSVKIDTKLDNYYYTYVTRQDIRPNIRYPAQIWGTVLSGIQYTARIQKPNYPVYGIRLKFKKSNYPGYTAYGEIQKTELSGIRYQAENLYPVRSLESAYE